MYRPALVEIYSYSLLQYREIPASLQNPKELHTLNIIKTAGNMCIDVTVRLVQENLITSRCTYSFPSIS